VKILPHINLSINSTRQSYFSMEINYETEVVCQYSNLKLSQGNKISVFSLLHDLYEYDHVQPVEHCAMHTHGVVVYETEEHIKIYTDPFNTIPIFYCEHEGIFLSSDILSCLNTANNKQVDLAGFWELIKYGICIGSRTLYKSIKQIPGASCLIINKNNHSYNIFNYWDYCVPVKSDLSSMNETVQRLDKILMEIFNKIISGDYYDNYVMGLSGGLDSRLSMNYLFKYLDSDNLHLFTFGNDKRTLEYEYAKQIAVLSGAKPPIFCKISDSTYFDSLNNLSKQTAGHINFMHGHISKCLSMKDYDILNTCQISNYFIDSFNGWSCVSPAEDIVVGFEQFKNEVLVDKTIPMRVRDEIVDDLTSVFLKCNDKLTNHNYSTFFEYFYMSEKNTKFHSYLMFNQSRIMPLIAPFTDINLVKFMLSVPINYKRGKYVIDELLNSVSIFSGESVGDTSSHTLEKLGWLTPRGSKFKLINRINVIVDIISSGKIRLNNVELTEDIQGAYHRNFRALINDAVDYLSDHNVLNTSVARKRFKPLRIRPAGIGENLQLLSIVEAMRSQDN
jgi:hypothetical protein